MADCSVDFGNLLFPPLLQIDPRFQFMNSACIGKVDEFHVKLLHFSLLLYEFHETHLVFILFFYNRRCRITISSLFA